MGMKKDFWLSYEFQQRLLPHLVDAVWNSDKYWQLVGLRTVLDRNPQNAVTIRQYFEQSQFHRGDTLRMAVHVRSIEAATLPVFRRDLTVRRRLHTGRPTEWDKLWNGDGPDVFMYGWELPPEWANGHPFEWVLVNVRLSDHQRLQPEHFAKTEQHNVGWPYNDSTFKYARLSNVWPAVIDHGLTRPTVQRLRLNVDGGEQLALL